MKQISRNEFYDIINTNLENKKILSSRHFVFELTLNDSEVVSLIKIPCMHKNIKIAVCDYNNNFFLLGNMSGFCKIYDYKTRIEIDRFELRYEPFLNNILLLDDGFIFIDKKGDIQKFSIYQKKFEKVDSFPRKISAIFRAIDGFFCISNLSSGEQRYSIISIKSMYNTKSISIQGWLWLCKASSDKQNLLICLNRNKGKGIVQEIFSVSSDLLCKHIISIDDYQNSEDGYFKSFSLSPDNKKIALLWNNCLKIFDLSKEKITEKVSLKYASDVEWISCDSLLVATWRGLYRFKEDRGRLA